MAGEQQAGGPDGGRFVWHPTHGGKSAAEVLAEVRTELASDQRQYALSLEGAEGHENSALRTVVELDRKWGGFDMGWAEADPAALAAEVVGFEQERERRREMLPVADYRAAHQAAAAPAAGRESLVDRVLGMFRGRGG